MSRAETDIGDWSASFSLRRLTRRPARRARHRHFHQPVGPARLPESARGRTYPGRENDTGDNDTDRNGGQGNDAGGHTNASACFLTARDAASLTPASATHRPCRAITPHTLDA